MKKVIWNLFSALLLVMAVSSCVKFDDNDKEYDNPFYGDVSFYMQISKFIDEDGAVHYIDEGKNIYVRVAGNFYKDIDGGRIEIIDDVVYCLLDATESSHNPIKSHLHVKDRLYKETINMEDRGKKYIVFRDSSGNAYVTVTPMDEGGLCCSFLKKKI